MRPLAAEGHWLTAWLTINSGVTRSKYVGWTDIYGERGARSYNGGLEAEPPAGSRPQGQSPWSGGQRGEVSLKLKTFYLLGAQRKQQICLIFIRPTPYGPTPPPEKKLVGFV